MAVDRWFFGIPNNVNSNRSVAYRSHPTKQTYIVAAYINLVETTEAGMEVKLVADNRNFNSGIASSVLNIVVADPRKIDLFVEVTKNSLYFLRIDPIGSLGTINMAFLVVELPGEQTRTREQVLAEAKPSDYRYHEGFYTFSAGGEIYLEKMVDLKQIIQPAQQNPPAVANELNIVSTSALDTLAGIGAQKVTFDYWDDSWVLHENNIVEMNGITPVNIVGTYNDVYLIKQAYVSQTGSFGRNEGRILFQDNA